MQMNNNILTVDNEDKIYSISTSSKNGSITTIHLSEEDLYKEIDNLDVNFQLLIIKSYFNSTHKMPKDFHFKTYAQAFPSDEGWLFMSPNYNLNFKDSEEFYSLSISVHTFNNNHFTTEA